MDLPFAAGAGAVRLGSPWIAPVIMLLWTLPALNAQPPAGVKQREYPASSASLRAALQKLGAYQLSRLPILEGFVQTQGLQLDRYSRPYYEFKIDFVPGEGDRTLVRVRANISAWYSEGDGTTQGYRVLQSNGRLETDLFDRLSDYLAQTEPSTGTPSKNSLEEQIATVHAQRLEAERSLSGLETQLQALTGTTQVVPAKFVAVARTGTPVLDKPAAGAAVLLKAQPEDEFEVTGSRGGWLRVKLDEARSGWVNGSQVQSNVPILPGVSAAKRKADVPADFTILRESTSSFDGDWSPLKGKTSLFVWAQPASRITPNIAAAKLRFAEAIFAERYREATHSADNSLQGIVVIFLDKRGGVAAARLDDIGYWLVGALTTDAFLARCSFDPVGAFPVVTRKVRPAGKAGGTTPIKPQ
jgi:hypothetical protein